MRKVLFIWAMLAMTVSAGAQGIELTPDGTYEVKMVTDINGVSAQTLYDRAVVALSDWTGASGKASAGLDIHDRDAGIIVYKGHEYMWTKKQRRQKYDVFADFSLKVRCKDGKAQITSIIHSMTAAGRVFNLRDAIQVSQKEKDSDERKHEIADRVKAVKSIADALLMEMEKRLKTDADDF